MKTQQVIENYCRLYKVDSPELYMQEKQFFVTISPDFTCAIRQNFWGK